MSKMATKIQTGNLVDFTATAALSVGDIVEMSDRIGVAQSDAEIGDVIALEIVGVYEVSAKDADVIAFGDFLYFDASTSQLTTDTDSVGDGSGTAYTSAGLAITTKAASAVGSVWVKIG